LPPLAPILARYFRTSAVTFGVVMIRYRNDEERKQALT
jgi:hypothetical protein